MGVEQMRDAIADVYSGWKWKDRVARMPEDQVMAVYFKFQSRGMFEVKAKKEANKPQEVKQLTIFDFIQGA